MKQILFATGNARKIQEANDTLTPFDIAVTSVKVEADEIQHYDSAEITKAKARAAYAVVNEPVVVADTSWEIPALGGFPGGYMKDISAWFQDQDWLALMARHEDKTILCHEHVAYFDGTDMQHFVETYTGTFVDEARGRKQDDESFERVVVMYGDVTMAERLAAGVMASAGDVLGHWQQFGEWYAKKA